MAANDISMHGYPPPSSPPTPYGLAQGSGHIIGNSIAQADRLTLQQQANSLIADIERAGGILDLISTAPTNPATPSAELPLGHALSVAGERLGVLLERLNTLAMHVGQI